MASDIQSSGKLVRAQGALAHDTADSDTSVRGGNNPVKLGAYATDLTEAQGDALEVAGGDITNLFATRRGSLLTLGGGLGVVRDAQAVVASGVSQTLLSAAAGEVIIVTEVGMNLDSAAASGLMKIGLGANNLLKVNAAAGGWIDHAGDGSGIIAVGAPGANLNYSLTGTAGPAHFSYTAMIHPTG